MDERYIIAPAALKAELFGAELNAVSAHGLLEHVLEPMTHGRTCEGILEEYAEETGGDLDKAAREWMEENFDALGAALFAVEQLIYDLIDAFLSDREQKTLDKHDAQTIRNNLWIADDLLADAQLEYHLHAGHGDAPCVQQYLESAARAKANVEDEEAHNRELKAKHRDTKAG